MGREVRMVPPNWEHPKDYAGHYKPLFPGDRYDPDAFMAKANADGLQEAIEWYGPMDREDYMPQWSVEEATHLQMYEDTTEGTPISPVMETPEELARWLADNKASAFGGSTATYEEWLATIKRGWAPSMVIRGGVARSGVSNA